MALYLVSRPGHVNPGLVDSMVVNADSAEHALAVSTQAFPRTEAGYLERNEWSTRFVLDIEYIGVSQPADRPAGVLIVSRKVVTE